LDTGEFGVFEGLDARSADAALPMCLTTNIQLAPSHVAPSGDTAFPSLDGAAITFSDTEKPAGTPSNRRTTFSTPALDKTPTNSAAFSQSQGSVKRRRRGTTKSRRGFSASHDLLSKEDAEELLSLVQGHLVVFPYDWLVKEEFNSNWLYQVDQVAPLQIYD